VRGPSTAAQSAAIERTIAARPLQFTRSASGAYETSTSWAAQLGGGGRPVAIEAERPGDPAGPFAPHLARGSLWQRWWECSVLRASAAAGRSTALIQDTVQLVIPGK